MHFWNNFKFDIVLIWQCWYHQFCHIFSFKEMFLYVTSILYLILKPILSNQNLCQPYSVYLHIWNNIWYIIICKIITYFCVYYIYTFVCVCVYSFFWHELEQTPGDGEGQGSLACCSSWGHEKLDTTWRLNNSNICAVIIHI